MKAKYFTYHWDEGFNTFATEEEAKGEAQRMLDDERDEAVSSGWNEDATRIYWGEIKQKAEMKATGKMMMFEDEMTEAFDAKLEPKLA